jgi:serine/threonine protein kinase
VTFSEAFTQHYTVERSLGKGAMGEVFLARDLVRGGQVAIKVVLDEIFADDDARLRFLREARITSALSHPNIIRVIDQGRDQGRLFLVFEYVEGGGLGTLLRERGPLSPEQFFTIAVGILDAMVYAHRQGVLHRDLKADNVLLDREGQPRIADFGLAKGIDNAGLETVTGTMMGTPSYMAPELAKGLTATAATDQYALGILLYQMLCAKAPFAAANPLELLQKHIEAPPPPIKDIRPDAPRKVAETVLRALAKTPQDRWPDLSALRDAINVMSLTMSRDWVAQPYEQQEGLAPLTPPAPPPVAAPKPPSVAGPKAPPVTAPLDFGPAASRPAPAPPAPPPAPSRAAPQPSRKPMFIAIGVIVALNVALLALQKRKHPPSPPSPTPVATVSAVASAPPSGPAAPLPDLIARLEKAGGADLEPVLEEAARAFEAATWKDRAKAIKLAHTAATAEAAVLAAGRKAKAPALRFLAGLAPGPLTGVKDLRYLGPTGKPDVDFPPALDGTGDYRRASWFTRPVSGAEEVEAKKVLDLGAKVLPKTTPAPPLVRLVVELTKSSMPAHVDVSFGPDVVICHRVPHGMGAKPGEEVENLVFSTLIDSAAVTGEPQIANDCGGATCPVVGRVGLAYVEPGR